jgi:hypothetical protein
VPPEPRVAWVYPALCAQTLGSIISPTVLAGSMNNIMTIPKYLPSVSSYIKKEKKKRELDFDPTMLTRTHNAKTHIPKNGD